MKRRTSLDATLAAVSKAMSAASLGILTLSWLLTPGCGNASKAVLDITYGKQMERNAKLRQALRSTLTAGTNPQTTAWNEFVGYLPSAWRSEGWTYDEVGKRFHGDAAAATLIHDRYVLKIILDFEASADLQRFEFPRVRYHFYEVASVRLSPEGGGGGGQSITFNPTNQAWFGMKEWKSLVESNWDFTQIGVRVVSNAPVRNIRTVSPAMW